ncbi:MAG: nuclear transport factor 2 family protein [Minwuia sp.]|nr:nuclear transport factor 2 family protein [Minwuia sp.]
MALSMETADNIMRRMGKALFSGDPRQMETVLTDDAEWHFAIGEHAPDGRVLKGVAGFLEGVTRNKALFETLRFEDIRYEPFSDAAIVMTYLVVGKHRNGDAFTQRGVEIITTRDGKVAKKDVFWKQTGPGSG